MDTTPSAVLVCVLSAFDVRSFVVFVDSHLFVLWLVSSPIRLVVVANSTFYVVVWIEFRSSFRENLNNFDWQFGTYTLQCHWHFVDCYSFCSCQCLLATRFVCVCAEPAAFSYQRLGFPFSSP